jgi:antitoxin MazE
MLDYDIHFIECISKEIAMKVSKWGNSLAIRIPADVAETLCLHEGDEVEATFALKNTAAIAERRRKIEDAWKEFEKVRHKVKWPADYKFDRDEANSRD